MSANVVDVVSGFGELPACISSHCQSDCTSSTPCFGCQFRSLVSVKTEFVGPLAATLTGTLEGGDVRGARSLLDAYFPTKVGAEVVIQQLQSFYKKCDRLDDAHIKVLGLPFYINRLLLKRGIKDVCSLLLELKKGDSLHHCWHGLSLREHIVRNISYL